MDDTKQAFKFSYKCHVVEKGVTYYLNGLFEKNAVKFSKSNSQSYK